MESKDAFALDWGGSTCFSITLFQHGAGSKMQHRVVIFLVHFSLSAKVNLFPAF